MAKEAFSASILESNLESLKNKTSEVSQQFKELSSAADSFGVKFSQSVRAATGNIQGLKSALNSLEGSIKRTTGTSSAIGAATISSSLGALTGQGRGGYGGYGGGGGGGGGLSGMSALSGSPVGAAIRATGAAGGGMLGALGGVLGGRLGAGLRAAGHAFGGTSKFAAATADVGSGMMMGAAKQSYSLQANLERMHRSAGVAAGSLNGGSALKARYGWGDIGYNPMEAFGVMEMLSGAAGAGGSDPKTSGMDFVQRAQALKVDPLGLRGLKSAAAAGGYGRDADLTSLLGGAAGGAMTRRGITDPAARGEAMGRRGPLMAAGVTQLLNMQAAYAPSKGQAGGMAGLLGVLERVRGPEVANRLGGALAGGTFAPGGGEAGALLQMRAGGFGNPNIRGYKQTALEMGINPERIKRRSYTEYLEWKEKSTVGRIQDSMVALQYENKGNVRLQAMQMQAMFGKEGMGYTDALKIANMGRTGGLGDAALQNIVEDFQGTKGGMDSVVTGQEARYTTELMGMRTEVAAFGEVVNKFQIANLQGITKGLEEMGNSIARMNTQLARNPAKLDKAYKKLGQLYGKIFEGLTELYRWLP